MVTFVRPLIEPSAGPIPRETQTHGCFETMRAYHGRIFRLESHMDRLYGSAQYLGTPITKNRQHLTKLLTSTLERSGLEEAVVRIALIPQRTGEIAKPHIVVQPVQLPPPHAYARGIRIAVVPAKKFSVSSIDAQAKYSARLGSVMAVVDAHLRHVDEALFLDEVGSVTESTASNFAIVFHGEILTPPCWLGLLRGVTRDVLSELAQQLHLPYRETPLTRHELYNADEALMTSTLKEVMPVTWIDGRRIGSGKPGMITMRLLRAFRALVRREIPR